MPPTDTIDPTGNLNRRDYTALHQRGKPTSHQGSALSDKDKDHDDEDDDDADAPHKEPGTKPAPKAKAVPPIPSLPTASIAPVERQSHLNEKKVSLSVTENVPLRDVLLELGRNANVNIEIDPRITGGVILTAHDQPFSVVLKRLCDLAGLRYSREGGFIRIELDEPYQKSYPLDYLSLSRKATNEVGIATNVFDVDISSGSNANGVKTSTTSNNNSISRISGVAEADFWSELDKSLPQVLSFSSRTRTYLAGAHDDSQNPAKSGTYSLDRQAGLVSVFANERQQKAVETYLNRLQQKASAQVLIEARIVEVELNQDYQSGINWRTMFNGSLNAAQRLGTVGASAPFSSASTATDGLFTASLKTGDFAAILSLVRTFGTTRVLSSPRLTVINNQSAVLKVARNEVYFITTAQYSTTTNSSGSIVSGTPVFTSTPKTVPVGLVMTVQPAIDSTRGKVTMTLRPSISRIVSRVDDPSIALNAAEAGITTTVSSQIPVLAVREMDSVIQLNSGEVAIMGGLMQDSSINQDTGTPPLDTLPLIGDLFKSRDNQSATTELVVLLRATILESPKPDEADSDLYGGYASDPRPLPVSRAKDQEEEKNP